MIDLPEGWTSATVGELGEYINGRGFKKTEWSASGRPIIRIQNLTGSGSSFNYFDGPLEDRYIVPPGSLLVSWAATLGVYQWKGPEGALNQHIFKVHSLINEVFHGYLLQYTLDQMRGSTHGTGMVHITRSRFDATPVSLPPIAEQKRIVAEVEEVFSKLDAGEAGLRNVRQLLKRLREAILTAAVNGRLVPQDPTEPPAAPSLVADRTMRANDGGDLPSGWIKADLGDLLDDIEAGRSFATRGHSAANGQMGVIKVSAMTRGKFLPTENKALLPGARIDERWLIRAGDLLFSRANTAEYVGACVIAPRNEDSLILSDKSLRLVTVSGVDRRWLMYALRARAARTQIEQMATGTKESMRNISQEKLRSLCVLIPPAEEQSRLADEVERQMSFVDACERTVSAGLERSAALRRSVLTAAFEGRLVPQDPSDEPASALLDRIRAERAARPASPGRARRRP